MKQVSINSVKPGMVLASNIHSRGKTLFRRGHTLRKGDIDYMRKAGLRAIPIGDGDGGSPRAGTINEKTREEAVTVVKEVLTDFENLTPKNLKRFATLPVKSSRTSSIRMI